MGGVTIRARLVDGGHTTALQSSTTYSSVVSREIVRIIFLLESLNDSDIFACNIGNLYLNFMCAGRNFIQKQEHSSLLKRE